MRTTIIPAQITTVEDTIAGNLNLTQILILMVPIFWTAIVYTLLPVSMNLNWYKIALMLVVLIACLILSLRVKGKLVLHWLALLLTYNLRPKYYLINKNDSYLRNLYLPALREKTPVYSPKTAIDKTKQTQPKFDVNKLLALDHFLENGNYSISYKTEKKGGINVAFREIKS